MISVADASVLVAALVDNGPDGRWAETAVAGGGLAGPELVLAEVTNILRRMERTRRISAVEAGILRARVMRLDLELFPFAPFADWIWALRNNLTCYDAWYIVLAESLGCPFITLDQKLNRAPGLTCETIVPDHSGPQRETERSD